MRRLSISDVCDLLNVKPHVLRYWERQVSLLQPAKSASGRREYSMRDLELIFRLKYLLSERKFTLDGAVQKLFEEAAGEHANAKGSLQAIRTTLLQAARHLKISAARALEIDADGRTDAAVLEWLAARPRSTFNAAAPHPYYPAGSTEDAGTVELRRRPAELPTADLPHGVGASAARDIRAVISLAPNWNISPDESSILEPLCPGDRVAAPAGGGGGGRGRAPSPLSPSPLELTAEKVRRVAAAARTQPRWIIAVPARSSIVVESFLAEHAHFGLPPETVSVWALPDLAAEASVDHFFAPSDAGSGGAPGSGGTPRPDGTPGPAYTSPMAALWGALGSGTAELKVGAGDGTGNVAAGEGGGDGAGNVAAGEGDGDGAAGLLLWMPLDAPFEEPPGSGVYARHQALCADVSAVVWERPGASQDAPRLVPTGTLLMRAASLPRILEHVPARHLVMRRNRPFGTADVISGHHSADQEKESIGPAGRAGLYVGIPEILAAAARRAVIARPGGPPRFVRTRDEARRPSR